MFPQLSAGGDAGGLGCAGEVKGLRRICTDETDQEQATAGTTAGPSTASLTEYVSNFAQDDRGLDWEEHEQKLNAESLHCVAR